MRIPFDRVAEIYDKTRGLPEQVMKRLIKTLVNELSGYGTILDAGVGTGRFAEPLQDSGLNVVGVDISKKMIVIAEERSLSDLLLSDVCFLPFKEKTFDATICIHVLHLISEWRRALREICRVTRSVMVTLFYVYRNPVREAYNRLLKRYGYESSRLEKRNKN